MGQSSWVAEGERSRSSALSMVCLVFCRLSSLPGTPLSVTYLTRISLREEPRLSVADERPVGVSKTNMPRHTNNVATDPIPTHINPTIDHGSAASSSLVPLILSSVDITGAVEEYSTEVGTVLSGEASAEAVGAATESEVVPTVVSGVGAAAAQAASSDATAKQFRQQQNICQQGAKVVSW